MKRIAVFALILCACFVSIAWAQQRVTHPMGRHVPPTVPATTNLSGTPRTAQSDNVKVYYLGHDKDGTWAEPRDINDFGVVVAGGDIAGGYTHQIWASLFGRQAGQWSDLGSFGGEDTTGWAFEGGGIADTGMIVGSAGTSDGHTHAFVWTPWLGSKVDLGTLAGDNGSAAIAVNKLGTLVTGVSYNDLGATAVVWTPKVAWKQGRPTITWRVQKLPTGGLDQPGKVFEGVTVNWWGGWSVNDFGQIAGDGWSDNYDEIAVMWTPVPDGTGWKITRLPAQSNYKYTEALAINESGEIVGKIWQDSTAIPALWEKGSSKGKTWNLTVLPTLSGLPQGWNMAWGINDVGDIVGVSNDADWNWLGTLWSTRDPNFAQVLGFPGNWSEAFKVNNSHIAVGVYLNDAGQEDVIAIQVP